MEKEHLLYKKRGGLSTGGGDIFQSELPFPLAKIEIYKDKIIIKYPLGKIELDKKDITYIEPCEDKVGLLVGSVKGIKINHRKTKVPRYIFFCSGNYEIINKLKEFGYKTKSSIYQRKRVFD
jgi:hypothetical protein